MHSPATAHCPEAQYAFELYRCLFKLLEGTTSVQAEFSYASDGRLDLFIQEKRWAIELLRDGDRTQNHMQRFRPGGTYHGWGIIQDYILLDFCTKWPTNRDCMGKQITVLSCWLLTMSTTDPNLCHVIFRVPANCDFVTVISSTDETVQLPHTPLLYQQIDWWTGCWSRVLFFCRWDLCWGFPGFLFSMMHAGSLFAAFLPHSCIKNLVDGRVGPVRLNRRHVCFRQFCIKVPQDSRFQ